MKSYGKELIIDIHKCQVDRFTREMIEEYFNQLCELIDMEQCAQHFWDYEDPDEYDEAPPHLKGISAVQFISTSNVTIHALDEMKQVYLNIFSCKDFNNEVAETFSENYFKGKVVKSRTIGRL